MSVSREVGPGEHLWLIDAVYRLDGLAPPPPPAASDSTAAVSRLVGPLRACAAALGRADTVRALALYEPMVDAVGGESGPNRDAAWCDVMVGLAALTRVVGDHGRSAVVLHRLDRALAVGAPLRSAWSHCRAMNLLAEGRVGDAEAVVAGGLTECAAEAIEHLALVRAGAIIAQAAGDASTAVARWTATIVACERADLPLGAASARQRLAAALAVAGDEAAAFSVAVAAIDAFDAARYRVETRGGRDAWLVEYTETIAIAIELAERQRNAAVVLELIERARTQVAPDEVRDAADGGSDALLLASPRPVRVGRARPVLGTARGTGAGVGAEPIDLDLVRRRLGGDEAWWWGTWRWRGALHWGLVAPDGSISSGSIDIARTLGDSFGAPFASVPPGRDLPELLDTMDRDREGERRLARALGDALVPEQLAAEAWAARRAGRRLRVVFAPSAATALLPVAAIGVPGPAAHPRVDQEPVRLVELADLQAAPSVAAAATWRHRDCGPAPISVVIADPLGDLPVARRCGAHIAALVGTHGPAPLLLSGAAATAAAVRAAMAGCRGGTVIVIAHVSRDGYGQVALADHVDERGARGFTAEGLWSDPTKLLVQGGAPSRLLLAACASAGLADLGVGAEWLGLAPALVRAGVATVVATTWPQAEHPATDRLDTELSLALAAAVDPVVAVGDVQRAWLERWRSDGWSTCAEQSAGLLAADHASPRHWAGVVVLTSGRDRVPDSAATLTP